MKRGRKARRARVKVELIISAKEVDRYIRFKVALVRWRRRSLHLSVELCAGCVGLSPKGWYRVEHGQRSPTEKTMVRMQAAVNLTDGDVQAAADRRKIKHLRRIGARNNCSNFQAPGAA